MATSWNKADAMNLQIVAQQKANQPPPPPPPPQWGYVVALGANGVPAEGFAPGGLVDGGTY